MLHIGSLAAGIQSSIGNVLAPSLFATCQSAAAGGYGVAAVNAAVQAGGVALAAGAGSAAVIGEKIKRKDGKTSEEEEKENMEDDEVKDGSKAENARL